MATIPKLTDIFKSHPVHLPTNKNLDSFQELPETYDWIQPNSFPSLTNSNIPLSDSVPLIDLSLPNVPELINNALRTWGVFQVINHDISISLLNSMESSANALFDLPTSQKLKAARTPNGAAGYGLARISTFFPKRMWSEGFTIIGSPLQHFQKLWPQDYSKYCDIMEEYNREMKNLCGRLMWLALGELGITREDMNWVGTNGDFKTSNAATQLNSYPICPNPDRAMGLGPHTDTSLLTIVYQNNTSGLQVLREGNRWVTVEPIPGALVVQVGDLLHIITNGLYPSSVHQAVVNRTRKRISVAYIFGPPETAEISPLKKLVSSTQPPLYPTVTWTGYLRKKAELFNNTLSSIRLCTPLTGLLDVNDHSQVKVG
ncbi:gibberellin 3-beta-dioxygenase 1-like [Benincasa hispida]|uniref:gibberellin 3-beta-dioxygenase 1-like n=1 Tax=Benincasa hispida TaxID=102211 RepID=UPI0019001C0E|nr:gibberellin 3-beta-dioxygenase 1-like [Benincasa hispida]